MTTIGKFMSYLDAFARCLIGISFLIAVLSKASNRKLFTRFADAIRGMRLLRAAHITIAALSIVAAEATIVLLVVIAPALGLLLSVIVLTVFSLAIHFTVSRGLNTPCRCFGVSSAPMSKRHIWRNIFLITIAIIGLLRSALPNEPDVVGEIIAIFAGITCGVIVAAFDDIIDIFAPTNGFQ
ncbi:MauE/DoxX family redox-associated membrane protein [Spongiactinospora gelatinilytica]|uniref:MauE/DoxX family redox-associated membrane protein n=1 Tax=Spongiactinospora gelatinilytica TaxID=2666298 RepID=UPI0011B94B3E|nr:MauE/DoxX family redox-associated membrane protein [Spongiactinospora gelatinilytica]